MKLLTTLTLLTICLSASGQRIEHFKSRGQLGSSTPKTKHKPLTFYPGTYFYTETLNADSTGMVVIIQNSLPKGGPYTAPNGDKLGYRIFFTRVINQTSRALELAMHFPATAVELTNTFPTIASSASPASPASFRHLFLPTDTMSLDKEGLYSYGVDIESFLNSHIGEATVFQRTIEPHQSCVFYIGVVDNQGNGAARTQLVFKEQNLFYRIEDIEGQQDFELVPCGTLVFKY